MPDDVISVLELVRVRVRIVFELRRSRSVVVRVLVVRSSVIHGSHVSKSGAVLMSPDGSVSGWAEKEKRERESFLADGQDGTLLR